MSATPIRSTRTTDPIRPSGQSQSRINPRIRGAKANTGPGQMIPGMSSPAVLGGLPAPESSVNCGPHCLKRAFALSGPYETGDDNLPVQVIDFRPRDCRRLDQLLLDLFLNALEPAFGADCAVLRAFDLGFEPVDPVFGGPQLLARLLQHLDDGAAGFLDGVAGAARFPRCESAHRFGYTARALTDRCRAVHGACAPR